ncbi:DUF7289 family protein [Natronobiforma cellulositropha]|uniref:DUF7289 family protein n=1 Tax=Natronobiforma cellulositropha TaxID=1679076 RepID=UPI0021D60C3A|nr:hypothetical protein [Natronobiforma cellulositropha]
MAPVLGFVILFGVVAIASVGILLVAGQTTTDIEQNAEKERIEGAFTELSAELETAASSRDVTRSVDLGHDPAMGEIAFVENGQIDVFVDDSSVFDDGPQPLRSLEWTATDGTSVAYQGGGVWRNSGDGSAVVSSPSLYHREGTFVLPVMNLTEANVSDDGDLTLQNHGSSSLSQFTNGGEIRLEVTSVYYGGWQTYLESAFPDAEVEVVDEERGYDGAQTVIAEIDVYPGNNPSIGTGVDAANLVDASDGLSGPTIGSDVIAREIDCDNGASTGNDSEIIDCQYQEDEYNSTIRHDPVYEPEDETIDHMIDTASNHGTDLGPVGNNENLRLDSGYYFADEIDIDDQYETIEVDLSDGDVVLAVEDDVNMTGDSGKINVVNAGDNRFSMYVGGDILLQNIEACVDGCDGENASANWIYGKSSSVIEVSSAGTMFQGVIFAPSNDEDDFSSAYDITLTGQIDFWGAIVGHTLSIQNEDTTMNFDEGVSELIPGPADENVVHLHVPTHSLEISAN